MKKVFLSLLALAAMVGCSKSELTSRPDNDAPVEIKLCSEARSIETRAPFEGEIADDNNLTARILVSSKTDDYTTTYHSGDMTFADNGTTNVGFNTTPAYYPADGSTIYLCGLYPADENWKSITTTADYTFDGKTDLMAAAQLSSTKTTAQGGTHPKMTFNHLLTKLVVKVVAADQAAIDSWGNVTGIVLSQAGGAKAYTKATVTLAAGTAATATAFSLTADSFPFYTMTGDVYNDTAFADQTLALTTLAANAAYSLVAPITANAADAANFKIKVSTKKGADAALTNEVPIKLMKKDQSDAAFEGDTQGMAFTITLTFKATAIEAAAEVTAWKDGGSSDVEIQ